MRRNAALISRLDAMSSSRSAASAAHASRSCACASCSDSSIRAFSARASTKVPSQVRMSLPMRRISVFSFATWSRNSTSIFSILRLSSSKSFTFSASMCFSAESTWIILAMSSAEPLDCFKSSMACSWAFTILLYNFLNLSRSAVKAVFSSSHCLWDSSSSSVRAMKLVSRESTRLSKTLVTWPSLNELLLCAWKDHETTESSRSLLFKAMLWLAMTFLQYASRFLLKSILKSSKLDRKASLSFLAWRSAFCNKSILSDFEGGTWVMLTTNWSARSASFTSQAWDLRRSSDDSTK
mmetsp:Transcript_46431/g.133708  ORF Transcript_46431/g.133708 Transcript_46431/m.133708 type:complete len:295 (-) Transcript_46431:298-1182(-)